MPYHDWSDTTFDWKSLNDALSTGTKLMERFGRIGVDSKEKFGSLRWNIALFNGSMHSLTHPSYYYSQYPKWLYSFDWQYRPLRFLVLPINAWQKLVVKLTFNYLVYKYPHIIDEIISDAPREMLSKELSKRAGKLWTTYCESCKAQYTCDNDFCIHCGEK